LLAKQREEERIRKEKEAAEKAARERAAEEERKVKAAAEEKKKQEEAERARQEEVAKKERDAKEKQLMEEKDAAQLAEAEKAREYAPRTAQDELAEYRATLNVSLEQSNKIYNAYTAFQVLKTQIMPIVRGKKDDQSMVNKDYRKTWSQLRRQFTPKIGQVTNSQAEIDRIVRTS
jgi:nucleoporin GLE1